MNHQEIEAATTAAQARPTGAIAHQPHQQPQHQQSSGEIRQLPARGAKERVGEVREKWGLRGDEAERDFLGEVVLFHSH